MALNNLQRLICHETQTTNQPFLNELELNCLHKSIAIISPHGFNFCYPTGIILFDINHLLTEYEVVTSITIQHELFYLTLFICPQSNEYCYVIPIIQFRHIVKVFQVFLFNSNNSIQHNSFVCTQLNGSNYCYVSLTIQINISHFFTHS